MNLNDMQQPLFQTKTFILKMSVLSYNSLPESRCNGNFDNLQPITEMSTDELFCDWLKQLQKVIELTFWQIVVQKYTSAKVSYESIYLFTCKNQKFCWFSVILSFGSSRGNVIHFCFALVVLRALQLFIRFFFDFGLRFVFRTLLEFFWDLISGSLDQKGVLIQFSI